MSTKTLGVLCLSATVALLHGCGGGGGGSNGNGNGTTANAGATSAQKATRAGSCPSVKLDPGSECDANVDPAAAQAAVVAPGRVFVGYYQEDPATNPEDPVPGAFVMSLPAADGAFAGSMYFTYVGCQNSNVGTVSGVKTGLALTGNWAGTIDGQAESGAYTGVYDPSALSYAGTYTHAGGKTFRNLAPCTRYWIAANGSWEMFAVGSNAPAGFAVGAANRTVSWTSTSAAAFTLIYVLDPGIAPSTGDPVLWQTVVASGTTVNLPIDVALTAGKSYVAGVAVMSASYQRLAFGSTSFVAP